MRRNTRTSLLARTCGLLLIGTLLTGLLPGAAVVSIVYAAAFTVTKTTDTNDGVCDADCSLREAIIAANATPGADSISLPAAVYTLSLGGVAEDAAATGDLDITGTLTITGTGAATSIIDGGGSGGAGDTVFHILAGALVEIS